MMKRIWRRIFEVYVIAAVSLPRITHDVRPKMFPNFFVDISSWNFELCECYSVEKPRGVRECWLEGNVHYWEKSEFASNEDSVLSSAQIYSFLVS